MTRITSVLATGGMILGVTLLLYGVIWAGQAKAEMSAPASVTLTAADLTNQQAATGLDVAVTAIQLSPQIRTPPNRSR